MEENFFKQLGKDYFVHPSEDPIQALSQAASKMGKTPAELLQNGWAGPIQQFIHHANVRDVIIQHNHKIWVRDRRGQKSIIPIELNNKWIDFLAYHWRFANSNLKQASQVDPLAQFRSTIFFPKIGGGMRFQYVGSAFSALGSSMYIRQLQRKPVDLQALVENRTIPYLAANLLMTLIRARTSIIISGQTGHGKTTMLGSLIQELQREQDPLNLLLIEKSHEIPLARPAYRWEEDAEGTIGVSELTSHAAQMGLEWLVLGECTGPEAYYLLKALKQGIPIMTTLHAMSASEAYRTLIMHALEEVQDPSLLPGFMKSLANEAVISINLELREQQDGTLLETVSGIDEIIGVSNDKPVVNPLWLSKRNSDTELSELVYNPGCLVQLSTATKMRLKAAGLDWPDQHHSPAAPPPSSSKSRGIFGRK